MKSSIIVLLAAVLLVISAAPAPQEFSTKYDAIDLDLILQNERLFKQYVLCFLTDDGCTPHAIELKKLLPEVLNNNCALCSAIQRATGEKLFSYIFNNMKDVFDQLTKRFDQRRS